jgi:acyl-CoA synthetase (AMP-forming)/AMP-acid ligase II/acetyltransferase-like isoleucine patch superfamily enzyme/acyl carrier protein
MATKEVTHMIFSPNTNRSYCEPAPQTIYEVVDRQASLHPERVAIAAPGRQPLLYEGLRQHIANTVAGLHTWGLNRNDRIAVVLPNGPEMATAFVAVASAATCAPLNPAYRESEVEFYLTDLHARALLIASGMNSPARQVAEKLGVPVIELVADLEASAGVFHLACAKQESATLDGFALPEDTALVLHTSGTTSRPKIVPLTQANVCTSGHNIALTFGLKDDDRCLNVMPLFHIHGLIGALLASLTAGAGVACTPGFDAERFFQWIDELHPTWYTAVPTMHQAILGRTPANNGMAKNGHLRFIRSCSASMPQRLLVELEQAFGTRVVESYGMTEASHQISSNPLGPLPRKLGSVGLAAGPDVAIMDEAGNLLPAGEVGEVVIRGPNVTGGYENNPKANLSSFTNGWFRTGDQGRFDNDGYLFLTGRLKEIINRGGEKIAPKEVDEVLTQHPAVAQAIAFAVPHPTLGEDVAAAITLKKHAVVSESELIHFAAARLAEFKVPRQVLIVDEIPKGPTGKPQRIGLADKLADQLASKRQANFVAAKSTLETQLSELWKELLKVDKVGVRDSFFTLGGDSLAMAVMLTTVEERFHKAISIESVLKSPTVEGVSKQIEERESSSPTPSLELKPVDLKPITDSVLIGVKNRIMQLLALYAPGYKTTRVWLHRMRGVSIGNNVSIGLSAILETAYPKLISIGNNVSIGMRTLIIAHLRDSTSQARAIQQHTVSIEDDVYIGPGVIVLPNVTIGRGAVVSAGSVVSRSVPAHTLVRGNPATAVAHCGVSLGGGVSYEEFVRHLKPVKAEVLI